ncbi:hypothetical protein [Marinobacter sp. VGCF2001]|uniref:hypothetical protein n=1 Tax=Marinobacter sp. VGCF2001 TaxID=3417189 RepID=UPI003CF7FF3C
MATSTAPTENLVTPYGIPPPQPTVFNGFYISDPAAKNDPAGENSWQQSFLDIYQH